VQPEAAASPSDDSVTASVVMPAPATVGEQALHIPEDVPEDPAAAGAAQGGGEETPALGTPDRQNLLEYLNSMYGLRLARSTMAMSLETVVTSPEKTVEVPSGNPSEINEFAREILIVVNAREISVNDYRSAHVTCTAGKGPCSDGFPRKSEKRYYAVAAQELSRQDSSSYVIEPLRRTLVSLQRSRSAVMKRLSPTVSGWLLDCDAYTLVADRDMSFGVIARIVHTAGLADLTRVRLAVTDENDMLAYIPLVPPALSEAQRVTLHVVGDSRWPADLVAEGFASAFLTFSATRPHEDFSGLGLPVLPVCLPMEIAWDRVLDDSGYARSVSREMDAYVAETVRSFGAAMGLEPPVAPDAGGSRGSSIPGAAVVPAPAAEGPAGSSVRAGGDGGAAAAGRPGPGKAVVPYLHVAADKYVLALKTLEGDVEDAVEIARDDSAALVRHLERASGAAVALSAEADLPAQSLVEALDAVRFTCTVSTMSARCRKYAPVKPTVFLFASPDGVFAPVVPPEDPGAAQ
jgi:hypothetical protein